MSQELIWLALLKKDSFLFENSNKRQFSLFRKFRIETTVALVWLFRFINLRP